VRNRKHSVVGYGAVLIAGAGFFLFPGAKLAPTEHGATAEVFQGATPLPTVQPPTREHLAERFGNFPLRFEKNVGQSGGAAQFIARGSGYSLFLSGTEATFLLTPPRPPQLKIRTSAVERMRDAQRRAAERVEMRMEIAGANPSPVAEPLDALETRTNYLIGDDPRQWHTNIVNYGRVRFREVYAGVDLIYHGRQRQLEYDFVVSPGRDPRSIRLRFSGADTMEVNREGDLVLRKSGSELRQQRPDAYQMVGDQRRPVEAHYEVRGDEVGFAVGDYDRSQPLTIDPLQWSSYFGGSGDETIFGIALDAASAVYVTGVTTSANLATTAGVVQPARNGAVEDAFVAKLNGNGTSITWCTYLGGTNYDEGDAIAVDATHNVYIGGFTVSSNFPGTAGNAQAVNNGLATTGNGFVAKLNTTGTALTFATYLGGGGPDGINGIALDAATNIYVTGFAMSGSAGSMPKFPTTAGVLQTAFGGTTGGNTGDAFVTKIASTGKSFVYSTYLGGSRDDQGWSIKVDAANNAYVAGETESTNFPTTAGTVQPAAPAKTGDHVYTGWVAEINPTATAEIFGTYIGGRGNDFIFGLALSATTGNIYFTGATTSNNLPVTAGVFQPANAGPLGASFGDAMIGALNSTGTSLVYLTYLGGSGDDAGSEIGVDASDFAWVAGFTNSVNFPASASATQKVLNGAVNAWTAKIRPGGTLLIHASYTGGSGTDTAFAAAIDSGATSSTFFAGSTTSANFPIKPVGALQPAYGGGATDGFVTRYIMRFGTSDFMPPALNFGMQTVGVPSAMMPITYKNIGNAALTMNSFVTSADYTQTNTCAAPLPKALAAGASCTINIVFTPSALGTRNGTLTVNDTAPGSPHVIVLTGVGK
jgi:hypothetical protein